MHEFDGSTNDEVALMSRKFKQMMKKKGKFQHSSRRKDSRFKKKNKEENKEIIYFECRKIGHMKDEYPQLKNKRYYGDKKKKILMVTWLKRSTSQHLSHGRCRRYDWGKNMLSIWYFFLCFIRWWRGYALWCSSTELSYDFPLVQKVLKN